MASKVQKPEASVATGRAQLQAAWKNLRNAHVSRNEARWNLVRFLRSETTFAYLLLAPILLLVVTFLIIPILSSAFLSLTKFNLSRPEVGLQFVGLGNYSSLILNDPRFRDSLVRTIYFSGVATFLGVILGLGFAIVLSQPFRGRPFVRALIIIPWAVPAVINGVMWRFIYSWEFGGLNALFYSLGILHQYVAWLGDPLVALNLVILADLWKRLPFIVVIFMAALTSIPEELIDAAKIDGANPLRVFRHITLPLLRPTVVVLLVLITAWSMQSFDLIYAITKGGPSGGTRVLPYFAWVTIFDELRYGEGAAVGYFITILVTIIGILYIKFFYREIEY